jgi:SET domain-containing protein
MFLVPTYLSQSSIHGVGVFTPEPIAEGTLLWEFNPSIDWKLTPEELAQFPEPYQSRFRMYCYLSPEGVYVFCGDNAKYMNHSLTPNCDDPEGRYTIANRDIEAGEELTSNYLTFDLESAEKGATLYEEDEVGADTAA